MQADSIVIGGGIAGLACAVALCDRGFKPLVVERASLLGGRARSWTHAETGDRVDIGPHIMLSEYRNMLALLRRLGTDQQVVWQQTDKFITLVDQPRPVEIRMSRLPPPLHFLPSMLGAPQVSWREMASNARLFRKVARLDEAGVQRLDSYNAEAFLREQGVSERFIDWFWRSAAMAIMNVPLERCSAGALLGFFQKMIGRSGYRVGFPAAGLGDLYVPAAVAHIEAAGGRVLTETAVAALLHENGVIQGVRLDDGRVVEAPHCVSAVPPQDLAPLLPEAWLSGDSMFRVLTGFAPSPYISAYLWFDRKLGQEQFWTRVWSPDTLGYDSYDLSNIRPGWRERPSLIATNVIYSGRAEAWTDEQLVAKLRQELAEFLPEAAVAELRHVDLHHIPMAIPAPYPGSEQLRPDARTPVRGLYLAGDWIRTGLPSSMESAVRAGFMAAEAILAVAGRPEQIALPPPGPTGLIGLLAGQ